MKKILTNIALLITGFVGGMQFVFLSLDSHENIYGEKFVVPVSAFSKAENGEDPSAAIAAAIQEASNLQEKYNTSAVVTFENREIKTTAPIFLLHDGIELNGFITQRVSAKIETANLLKSTAWLLSTCVPKGPDTNGNLILNDDKDSYHCTPFYYPLYPVRKAIDILSYLSIGNQPLFTKISVTSDYPAFQIESVKNVAVRYMQIDNYGTGAAIKIQPTKSLTQSSSEDVTTPVPEFSGTIKE